MDIDNEDRFQISEKNIIHEKNRINLHPGEENVGALLRQVEGLSKQWRAFVYVKKGVFLEEYLPSKNRLEDSPRQVVDITGVRIMDQIFTPGVSKSEQSRIFSLTARNGTVLLLMASTMDEKRAWIKILTEYSEKKESTRTRSDSVAANIAPVRRRQNIVNNQKSMFLIDTFIYH